MSMLEILSRHWAVTSCAAGTGRGGIPELTEADVAHALGCIEDKRSRDSVMVLWNHAGVPRTLRSQVEADFRALLVNEHANRVRDLVSTKLELHLMECEYEGINNMSLRTKALRPYQQSVDRAKSRLWPWDALVYRRLFGAVALEIRNPRICPDCNGRSAVMIGERRVVCPGCEGIGKKPYMRSTRSSTLGVTYPAYRSGWAKVYEWAYAELHSRQRGVLDELVRVLAREEIVAA